MTRATFLPAHHMYSRRTMISLVGETVARRLPDGRQTEARLARKLNLSARAFGDKSLVAVFFVVTLRPACSYIDIVPGPEASPHPHPLFTPLP